MLWSLSFFSYLLNPSNIVSRTNRSNSKSQNGSLHLQDVIDKKKEKKACLTHAPRHRFISIFRTFSYHLLTISMIGYLGVGPSGELERVTKSLHSGYAIGKVCIKAARRGYQILSLISKTSSKELLIEVEIIFLYSSLLSCTVVIDIISMSKVRVFAGAMRHDFASIQIVGLFSRSCIKNCECSKLPSI